MLPSMVEHLRTFPAATLDLQSLGRARGLLSGWLAEYDRVTARVPQEYRAEWDQIERGDVDLVKATLTTVETVIAARITATLPAGGESALDCPSGSGDQRC